MSAQKSDFSGKSVLWLDQGWQPAYIGFCPSRTAWNREMRKMGVKNEPWPEAPASTQTFEYKGALCIIVTLGPESDRGHTRIGIAGLIAHEATHVWQYIRKHMGETDPSVEFEAYSVQAIFQNLYRAWFDVRGHLLPPDKRSV